MALKKYKPTTPGQRHKIVTTFDDITCSKPENRCFIPPKNMVEVIL